LNFSLKRGWMPCMRSSTRCSWQVWWCRRRWWLRGWSRWHGRGERDGWPHHRPLHIRPTR